MPQVDVLLWFLSGYEEEGAVWGLVELSWEDHRASSLENRKDRF